MPPLPPHFAQPPGPVLTAGPRLPRRQGSGAAAGIAPNPDAILHASPDPEKINAGGVVRTGSGRS